MVRTAIGRRMRRRRHRSRSGDSFSISCVGQSGPDKGMPVTGSAAELYMITSFIILEIVLGRVHDVSGVNPS
jgi:hypothetical protein